MNSLVPWSELLMLLRSQTSSCSLAVTNKAADHTKVRLGFKCSQIDSASVYSKLPSAGDDAARFKPGNTLYAHMAYLVTRVDI